MFYNSATLLCMLSTVIAISSTNLQAQEQIDSSEKSHSKSFGGPDSVENTIADNKKQQQKSWRDKLENENGITLGLDYHALGVTATNTIPDSDESAAAGVIRFYGSWQAVGRGTKENGNLVWKVEHRHKYTDGSVKDFGMGSIGAAGMIGPAYSDQGLRLTNLYWKQYFNGGKTSIMTGFLDTTDYVDTYALASPWSGFTNLAFSTGAAAIGLPDDGTLGFAVGHMFTDNLYGIAGITDAHADSSEPFKGFEQLFDQSDLFTSVEFGWTASQDRIYLDNIHLTFWHLDGGTRHSVKDSHGVNFSASYQLTDNWMPFLRGGFSQGDATLVSESISAGVGYFGLGNPANTLGFAINWAAPNAEAFGEGHDNQTTAELYYNITINEYVSLTPDIQYVNNPTLNFAADDSWVFGLRAKVAL